MAEQHTPEGEWVVVRRPGVVRLADTVVKAHNASSLTRHRGDTMIALAETLAASRVGAEIISDEPDGSRWSMTITAEGTTR